MRHLKSKSNLSVILFHFILFFSFVSHAHDSPHHLKNVHHARTKSTINYKTPLNFTISGNLSLSTIFNTDRSGVYFNTNQNDLKTSKYSFRIGLEKVFKNRLGIRALIGYEHPFYSNINTVTIKKHYLSSAIQLLYFFKNSSNRLDWYLLAGESFLYSSAGNQLYTQAGGGFYYHFKNKVSLKSELALLSDFSGFEPKITIGLNYHF
ncbi:hypothetical protein BVY03_00160 [bacterium K02(2017)]|nr:hypothetical protein BVY03_00160 [bacterium K02(2017)]